LNDAERIVTVPPYLNIRYFPVLSQLHDLTAPRTLAMFPRRVLFRLHIFITPCSLPNKIENPSGFTDTQITPPVCIGTDFSTHPFAEHKCKFPSTQLTMDMFGSRCRVSSRGKRWATA
jgi:hypothetical protein